MCGSSDLRKVRLRHGFHLVVTVATMGVWGVSWLALAIGARFWPWRCAECGHRPRDYTGSPA